MFRNTRGITAVIILAVLVGTMLVGGCNLNSQKQETEEENLYMTLTKGEDSLWEVESYGDIGELIGIAVIYTTGPPYPGAGTFNADLYAKTRFIDQVSGDEVFVALMLGNLNVSEGVESTVEYPFAAVVGIGEPKKIGVRLHDKQDVEIKRIEAIIKPYPPDPY